MVPPPPAKLARTPYWAFHALGIERRRADTIRAAAAAAHRFESLAEYRPRSGSTRLSSLPGIGPWTAAEAIRLSFGDPDAVSVGDYHLPGVVCWALAGERDGTDERMLELLEPYAGQRARVVLLIERPACARAPRPRMAPRRSRACDLRRRGAQVWLLEPVDLDLDPCDLLGGRSVFVDCRAWRHRAAHARRTVLSEQVRRAVAARSARSIGARSGCDLAAVRSSPVLM